MRRPLGLTILGGLFVSQLLTLYSVPVIYLWLDRIRLRVNNPVRAWRGAGASPAKSGAQTSG